MGMTHDAPPTITDALIREIADAAAADHRSVLRHLAGLEVRGRRSAIIDRELRARGLIPPVAPPAAPRRKVAR
jgi:hypothetical protein